jgi:hypothetical protein
LQHIAAADLKGHGRSDRERVVPVFIDRKA